jgi:hypothetical protein
MVITREIILEQMTDLDRQRQENQTAAENHQRILDRIEGMRLLCLHLIAKLDVPEPTPAVPPPLPVDPPVPPAA